MTEDRRYGEEEVAAIFELATRTDEPGNRPTPEGGDPARGMTLAELQEIGAEVGIAPERIAQGARALTHRSTEPEVRRTLLGFPISVGGEVDLPRPLTEAEWDRLVSEIRTHFNAHGKLDQSGTLRSWRNGNLRVELAPTEEGQKIRMQTLRQQSQMFVRMGGVFGGVGVALGIASIIGGGLDPDLWTFGALGGGFLAAGLAPLRTWAGRRRAQMEAIAASAVRMASRALPGRQGDGPPAHETLPPAPQRPTST
ncbi:MAG: hypothetical protein HKO53_00010 [Gemmatimonadetes bacterium]|nr:hypothetical protein [Gemmatimonadota bacterium]